MAKLTKKLLLFVDNARYRFTLYEKLLGLPEYWNQHGFSVRYLAYRENNLFEFLWILLINCPTHVVLTHLHLRNVILLRLCRLFRPSLKIIFWQHGLIDIETDLQSSANRLSFKILPLVNICLISSHVPRVLLCAFGVNPTEWQVFKNPDLPSCAELEEVNAARKSNHIKKLPLRIGYISGFYLQGQPLHIKDNKTDSDSELFFQFLLKTHNSIDLEFHILFHPGTPISSNAEVLRIYPFFRVLSSISELLACDFILGEDSSLLFAVDQLSIPYLLFKNSSFPCAFPAYASVPPRMFCSPDKVLSCISSMTAELELNRIKPLSYRNGIDNCSLLDALTLFVTH